MKDNLKRHQKLLSPGRRDEKLSKVAEPERERSINRPVKGKPTGHAGIQKPVKHDKATNAIQTDRSAKEKVDTDHKRTRYASLREVSPNASMGEVF